MVNTIIVNSSVGNGGSTCWPGARAVAVTETVVDKTSDKNCADELEPE